MTYSLRDYFPPAGLLLAAAAVELPAQFINHDFVTETPDAFVAQPDLDGDGTPDLVLADRSSGVLRFAILDGNELRWLDPVQSGIEGITTLASGNFEQGGIDSVAVASGPANRINVFGLDGSGAINRAPRSVFNGIFGVNELAAIEDPVTGTPLIRELVGFSRLAEPSSPGLRDFLSFTGGALASYDPGHPGPDRPERDYRQVLVEPGLEMLSFFLTEVDPEIDLFTLAYLGAGDFEILVQIPVSRGARMIHASFDQSGAFQFVFHLAGSASFECHTWTGSGLSQTGSFVLSQRASQLFPFFDGSTSGLLARSLDGLSLTFYAFDGFNPPVEVSSFGAASNLPLSAPVMLPTGQLLVLSGLPGSDPHSDAELFEFGGKAFVSLGNTAIPPAGPAGRGTNVLLYAGAPFITENAPLTGRLGTGVWTSAVSVGANVEVLVESYGGATSGLYVSDMVNLGTPPPGTTNALVNTIGNDISLYDSSAAIGVLPGTVVPVPDPGTYNESVSVGFAPTDPSVQVLYRILPDGSWATGPGPAGPFFQSVSLQYFGRAPDGRRTPIRSANYLIPVAPSDLDSDRDGVPDYVEIEAGLDPVASGDDADGDGYSDLIELLAGSNPGDPLSFPPSREVDTDGDGFSDLEETIAGTDPTLSSSKPATPGVLNFQNVFDLLAVPYSHDGSNAADPFVPSLDAALEIPGGDPLATSVRLYALDSSLIGVERTATHGLGGVTDPAAYLAEVAIDSSQLPTVVATERNFPVNIPGADRRIGRQVAGLVKIPPSTFPPVAYEFGGSGAVLALEAAAWLGAARSRILSTDRQLVVQNVDLYNTLSLLLAEVKLEGILRARGLIGADPVTLTGFRSIEGAVPLAEAPGDGSRPLMIPRSLLSSLRHKEPGIDSGYRLDRICEVIEQCVEGDLNPGVLALRDVAQEIYRISAATGNATPGALVSPLDALRSFIRTGSLLNTGYLANPEAAPLDAPALASASAGISHILGKEMSRPVTFRQLKIIAGGLSANCSLLEDTFSAESVSLIDFQGNPFPFPDSFQLPEDSVLVVEGYADVSSDCPADAVLEVIPPVQLVSLPVAATSDANQNLIPDDLEDLYAAAMNPFADSDSDGFTDLQETLDGTNPFDIAAFPAGAPVDLLPPVIRLDASGPTHFNFHFEFPAAYADNFAFRLFSGPDLQSLTTDTGFNAPHTGGGAFQLIISKPAELPVFYRFQMLLD